MTYTLDTDINEKVDEALYVTLATYPSLSALVGDRVFNEQAPAKTPYPFITFQRIAGGLTNDTDRPNIKLLYQAVGIAQTRETAMQIAKFITQALHRRPLTIALWDNYWIMQRAFLSFPAENVAGNQLWRKGGEFDIQADQTG